jgi:hypothetical protein
MGSNGENEMRFTDEAEKIIALFRNGRHQAAAAELRKLAQRMDNLRGMGSAPPGASDGQITICAVPPKYFDKPLNP